VNIAYIWKISPQGNTIWYRRVSESGNSSLPYSIAPTFDGGCVIVGISTVTKSFFIRVDGNGAIVLQKKINVSATLNEVCHGLTLTPDSCYIGAVFVNYSAADADMWYYKINMSGTVLWMRSLDALNNSEPTHILPTSDGGYIIGGESSVNSNSAKQSCLIKLDSAGHYLWSKTYSPNISSGTPLSDVREMPDHGFIIFTAISGFSYMVRTDSAGNLLWTKRLNNGYFYQRRSTVANGVIYTAGHYYANPSNYTPAFIRVKDDSLNFCSTTRYQWLVQPYACTEASETLFTTPTTNFVSPLATLTFTTPSPYPVSSLRCSNLTTGEHEIAETENTIAGYPNPGSNDMIIHCANNLQGATFSMTGMDGKLVEQRENVSGQDIKINVSGIAAGMYFFRISNENGEMQTGKLVVNH
jgi:outer membrane protein assembly factor BamB